MVFSSVMAITTVRFWTDYDYDLFSFAKKNDNSTDASMCSILKAAYNFKGEPLIN